MTGSNHPINPKDIDQARQDLWKKYRCINATKAALFNLVVYVRKNSLSEEYVEKLIHNVVKKFPCRIILIMEVADQQNSYLHTFVSDLQIEGSSSFVFCDIVRFEVCGKHVQQVPFLLFSNILANLPIYLLWTEDLCELSPISFMLEQYITRIVFDSETTKDLFVFAQTLLNLHKKFPFDIGDINWARLSSWRALFAHAFNSPSKLQCIQNAHHIIISFNEIDQSRHLHNKIQAIYFQAWIASKLHWTFSRSSDEDHKLHFLYASQQGEIAIEISPKTHSQVLAGRILELQISSKDSKMSFSTHSENSQQIILHYSTEVNCEMPVYYLFDKDFIGRSIIQEIYSQGTKTSFLEILHCILQYQKEILHE